MLSKIRTAAISGLVGISALSGMTAGARAEGLYFGFDDDGETRAGITIGGSGEYREPRRDDRWDRNDDRRDRRERRRERECTPERALDKAERLGLYRVRIVDVDRRTIDVVGRRDGERIYITFARAPHCPVIR